MLGNLLQQKNLLMKQLIIKKNMNTDNLLSTKFIYATIAIISGLVLCCMGIVSGQDFFKFAEVIGGIYVVGNVGQKFIK